jgi:hypothetical protein
MGKTVTLKLTNCLDCPHHKVITSTSTGDSFDMGDVDVVCTLARGTHRGQFEVVKGRAITLGDRFVKRSECAIPTWCPLTKKTNRKK